MSDEVPHANRARSLPATQNESEVEIQMTIGPTNVRDAQKQYLEYLDALKDGQKAVIDAVEFWSNAFESSVGKPAMHRSPEQLASPRDLVEGAFNFAERLVAAQKEFALALVDAATLDRS
jgi:hypothetical protein